jgi:ABC-type spermidine/putrescine transport system permease subunit I
MSEHDVWHGDDVERLLARLEPVAPPPDFAARVLARTTRRARVRWGFWVVLAVVAGLAVAALAAVSGYLAGRELVESGAYDLVRLGAEDWELVSSAPGEYFQVLAEALPWASLAATLACIVAAYLVAQLLTRAPALYRATAQGAQA